MKNNSGTSFKQQRRNVLKGIGAGSAVVFAPAFTQATSIADGKVVQSVHDFNINEINGLTIEFSDAGASKVHADLVRVSISNMSDTQVKLTKLSPGAIVVNGREYNLNSRLARSPISVSQYGLYHLWLSPEKNSQSDLPDLNTGSRGGMVTITVVRADNDRGVYRHSQLAHASIA